MLHQENSLRMSPSADSNSVKLHTLAEANALYIRFVLDRCGGDRKAAARLLGIRLAALGQHLRRQYSKESASARQSRILASSKGTVPSLTMLQLHL
jgi:DNA-binding NtrC family response regulator